MFFLSSCFFNSQSTASTIITSPLVDLIVQQTDSLSDSTIHRQSIAKRTTQKLNRHSTLTAYNHIRSKLFPSDLRYMDVTSEKGASSWLTVLPIKRHGFHLHKGAFRDGLCLRYGLRPPSLPESCVCGKQYSIEHSFSCLYGGFPTLRHNDVRDLTAELMKPITWNLTLEPTLQTLSGETFNSRSCCISEDARADIKADGFWDNRFQSTYFDVRVFNPFSKSYRNKSLTSLYRQHEQEKLRKYEERITHVEHGSFTPLVFTTSGGLSPITTTAFKRICRPVIRPKVERWVSHNNVMDPMQAVVRPRSCLYSLPPWLQITQSSHSMFPCPQPITRHDWGPGPLIHLITNFCYCNYLYSLYVCVYTHYLLCITVLNDYYYCFDY